MSFIDVIWIIEQRFFLSKANHKKVLVVFEVYECKN